MSKPTIAASPPMQQEFSKDDWLKARQHTIGSSDAPTILGCNPYKSVFTLWAEKTGLLSSAEESEAMLWGTLLEPIIAEEYGRRTGRTLVDHGRYTQRIHPDIEWMTATLDREIVADREHPTGALEVKSTSAYLSRQWSDEPPLMAQIQLQHALAVTGWSWGSVAGLIGGQKFLYQDQQRDEAFISLLMDKEGQFIECMRRGTPPEPDGSASTAETLKELYKKDTGPTVVLPNIAMEWDARLQSLKKEMDNLKSEKDDLENKLKAEIKDAPVAVLPNGVLYSYRLQERAGYTVEPTSFRVLRRSAGRGARP